MRKIVLGLIVLMVVTTFAFCGSRNLKYNETTFAVTPNVDFVGTSVKFQGVKYALNKVDAVIAPTVNNDTTQGYSAMSMWIDIVASKIYICTDPTTGAAVWEDLTGNAVSSVFTRTGAVTAQNNDYTWGQVDKTVSSLADVTTKNHGDLTLNDGTNPHGTTKTDVGLANVTNDAQVKKVGGDIMAPKLTISDSATTSPLNLTERSSVPSVPVLNDVYMDDGTNTASSLPGLRRYTGAVWEDVGGGTPSPLTIKGDLYTFSTVDARLPIGTNGYLLTPDSLEATGLKWLIPTGFKLDDWGTPDDNTDLNATSSYHGLLMKLSGSASDYLKGDGNWGALDSGEYGGLSVDANATATTINTLNVWEQFLLFDTNSPANGATPDHTNDHITVGGVGDYFIALSASVSGVASDVIQLAVYKNNGVTALTDLICEQTFNASGNITTFSISGIVTLSASDTIELWVRNTTDTDNVTIKNANLVIFESGIGIVGGDVLGPVTNTDNYIPQWNGANSKTLKDGRAIGNAINAIVERTALNTIATDTVTEIIATNGVLVDNLRIKDSGITDILKINATTSTELTIATGAITVTQWLHRVDGEGDVDDDLDTINGGVSGSKLTIYPENVARNITIRHGTGNIVTPDGLNYIIPDNGLVELTYDGFNWRMVSGGSSGVNLTKQAWVDLTNGNNTTAIVGDIKNPYQTIQGAITAVEATITTEIGVVYVTAGAYSESLTIASTKNIILVSDGGAENTGTITNAGYLILSGMDIKDSVLAGAGTYWIADGSSYTETISKSHTATGALIISSGGGIDCQIAVDFSNFTTITSRLGNIEGKTNLTGTITGVYYDADSDKIRGISAIATNSDDAVSKAHLDNHTVLNTKGGTGVDSSTWTGYPHVIAGVWGFKKSNLGSAVAPTSSNDNTQGYGVGSEWIDTTADKAYVCLDASTGTAVWTETTQSGGGGGGISGTPARLGEIQQVAVAATSVYTNPVSTVAEIQNIIIHNTNTTAETITIWVVPDNAGAVGTAADANKSFRISVASNETVNFDFEQVGIILTDTNDTIQMSTTTVSKVTVQLMGATASTNDRLTEIVQIAAAAGAVYTNAAATTAKINTIIIHNTNTIAETVSLYNVPDNAGAVGTAADANKFYRISVASNETIILDYGKYGIVQTDTNDTIQASTTTASKVTIQIYGDK